MEFNLQSQRHAHTEEWNWNKEIWNVKTISKIKLFLWKAANDSLPTRERLMSRKIIENHAGAKCGEPETISHILFHCSYAKHVWDHVPVATSMTFEASQDFKTIWSRIKEQICLPPTGLTISASPWICWQLWKARNNNDFNDRAFTVEETTLKALLEAKEWYLAQSPEKKLSHTSVPIPNRRVTTRLICKTDGAWRRETGTAGIGWIFIGNQGRTFEKHKDFHRFVTSALVAEGLALRAAMATAVERGFRSVGFESDSQQLIQAVLQQSEISEMHGILYDIESLKSQFEFISFSLIKRAFNEDADLLA